MQPRNPAASSAVLPEATSGPNAVPVQGQLSTALHAADTDTQSDRAEETQPSDEDLTQEDHPCIASPHQSQHDGGVAVQQASQHQASTSRQHQMQTPLSQPTSRQDRHGQLIHMNATDAGGHLADLTDTDMSQSIDHAQSKGNAAGSEEVQMEDESMDDLLEFLADAAAADELQQHANTAAAQPETAVGIDTKPSSSNAHAQQHQAAAAVHSQSQQHRLQTSSSPRQCNNADAMLSIDLDSPGGSGIAACEAGRNKGKVWVADDKDARMAEAVKAVGLSRAAGAAGPSYMQPTAAALPGTIIRPSSLKRGLMVTQPWTVFWQLASCLTYICDQAWLCWSWRCMLHGTMLNEDCTQ